MSIYYGPGPIETTLSFILFFLIIAHFLSKKNNRKIKESEDKPIEYKKMF